MHTLQDSEYKHQNLCIHVKVKWRALIKIYDKILNFKFLTSNNVSRVFTYNLLTPIDFPIDAKNNMTSRNNKKGVKSRELEIDTSVPRNAILETAGKKKDEHRFLDYLVLFTLQRWWVMFALHTVSH